MAKIDARQKLEQIRRNKGNNKAGPSKGGNVKDLRQLIAKKKKSKGVDKSPNRVSNNNRNRNGATDLREINKKLAARRSLPQTKDNRSTNRTGRLNRSFELDRQTTNTTSRSATTSKPFRTGKQFQQQQYYKPPHTQQPTYIFTSAAPAPSNLAMDNVPEAQGASILVSNLPRSITQADVIELFGDLGIMTGVNIINETTALVTYRNSSDAIKAVKTYHNRLLDNKPMMVNMMPNSTPISNIRYQ